ncbi:hypothetical protein [Rossellomorea marisflavi]|uniref:hypothetical protein n=1 Tax=Rossellomorea marisflavi TaxID=189381 RepID=UPI00345DA575
MSAYDEIQDLYNFDQIEEFKPVTKKTNHIIDNESFNGYSFQAANNENVFAYRTNGTMGNHWYLYSLDNHKHLFIGRMTKKQIIEEAGRL